MTFCVALTSTKANHQDLESPFLSTAEQSFKMVSLLSVSHELLEIILSHIDGPHDLISVALSSKLLSKLVIPNHLHLRHISCDIFQEFMWKMFVERPGLAINVRQLDLAFRPSLDRLKLKRIPSFILKGDPPVTAPYTRVTPESLPLAIAQMTFLTSFSYLGPHVGWIIRNVFEAVADLPALMKFGFHFRHSKENRLNPLIHGKVLQLPV